MNRQADIALGKEAVLLFHNRSVGYSAYQLNFDQLLDRVAGGGVKNQIFLEGLGMGIRNAEVSSSKLQKAMERLADTAKGRIPDRSAFFQSLSEEVQNINWLEEAPKIAFEVAKDVAQGVAEGGETVITTLKSLNVIAPILIVGAVIFIFVSKVKKVAA